MSLSRTKEEVRDGYLGDLPEDLRIKLMNIHKMIVDAANSEFKKPKYDCINKQQWAKTMLDEFLTVPTDNSLVGSVRLYKKGKRCRCMIQISGHVTNNRNTEDEEIFHGFIRDVHMSVRSKVRRKFDVTLSCESEHGENFEGFDVWTKQKEAAALWELFADKKSKVIKPVNESGETEYLIAGIDELPTHLQTLIEDTNRMIYEAAYEIIGTDNSLTNTIAGAGRTDEAFDIGHTVLRRGANGIYEGSIMITPPADVDVISTESADGEDKYDNFFESLSYAVADTFNNSNPTKELILSGSSANSYFEMSLDPTYVEKLWEYLENTEFTEASPHDNGSLHESAEWDPFTEADNGIPEYNVDMSEAQAKKTLRTCSQDIMNNCKKDGYKVTQYTANIYANIITKNLLPLWAKGYRKFSITLDSYQSLLTFEFKIPNMTQDFVSRFIDGRESIDGFLHHNPEIRVKMSPRIFHNMKSPDDAYNFFKAAIKYYDSGIAAYSTKMMGEVMKLNREMKHLISTTKLSGIVTCPMQLLFVFDDVQISDKNTFKISQDDIKAVNQFVRNIYTRYAAPEKEKKQIIDDLNKVVTELRENCEFSPNIADITHLTEAVQDYFDGKFDNTMAQVKEKALYENLDLDWCNKNPDPQIRYLQEKFGVKKLKKIPRDLVAYITIETESIRDANDKMMIASYCIGKIEIVEWYIELLEVGSKKYIVPHSKPYLETLRTDLLACYKKIMDTKIPNPNDRPIVDIKYPKGYEG